jgi:hypothetical protein
MLASIDHCTARSVFKALVIGMDIEVTLSRELQRTTKKYSTRNRAEENLFFGLSENVAGLPRSDR